MVLMLDTKSRLIKDTVISRGTVNASIVSAREIFCESLKYGAVSIILMHNHPSGDPSPSNDDINVTIMVKEAGELIGIPLSDHIIIGDGTYQSLLKN